MRGNGTHSGTVFETRALPCKKGDGNKSLGNTGTVFETRPLPCKKGDIIKSSGDRVWVKTKLHRFQKV